MRVRRSPHFQVEIEEDGRFIVRERLAGNRATLTPQTLAFLDRFEQPAEVAETQPELGRMLDLGFLVEEGRETRALEAKLLAQVAPRMFGCPAWQPGEPCDFALLGVPFDAGNLTAPGARYGPDALRTASSLYAAVAARGEPGRVEGWVDHDTGARILEGARLRDAGDVFLSPGAGAEPNGLRITEAVRRLAASEARPLILGGDHSITFAAVRGVRGTESGRFGVIHLDAHSDAGALFQGVPHHYGNVMSRIVDELGVENVVQVGVRGPGHADPSRPPGRRAVSPGWLRSHAADDFLQLVDPGLAWYVTVDIDVIDPAFAPGTATPVCGGLTVAETKDLLRWVGETRRVIGGDLVEINPQFDHNRITANLGCELLLTLMGSMWRGPK
jgi:agmatinase